MGRMLYIVTREQPMLCGYLMARVSSPSREGHLVEIKVDERRAERRVSSAPWTPERRRRERRRQPSLDDQLSSRGYATVIQHDDGPAEDDEPELAMAWRPRSSWRQRAARLGRRRRRRGLIVGLLVVAGVAIGVAAATRWMAAPPGTAAPPGPAPLAESEPPQPAPPPPSAPLAESQPSQPAPPTPPVQSAPPRSEAVAPRPAPPSPAPPTAPQAAETSLPPPAPQAQAPRPAPARRVSARSSGTVLAVDAGARGLVLEDQGVAAGRRRVEVARDARIVLSERDPQAADLSHPFKDTVIDLSEIRRGDYVVVEVRGPEGKELARSVVVTFRPGRPE